MRVRVAWKEEKVRRSRPSTKYQKPPKEGKPNTLILSADNDTERELLHNIYRMVYSELSVEAGKHIIPISFQEGMKEPDEN